MPIVPSTQEAEAGGSLEPREFRHSSLCESEILSLWEKKKKKNEIKEIIKNKY